MLTAIASENDLIWGGGQFCKCNWILRSFKLVLNPKNRTLTGEEKHKSGKPQEDGGRDWSFAAPGQGVPGATASWKASIFT